MVEGNKPIILGFLRKLSNGDLWAFNNCLHDTTGDDAMDTNDN